MTTAAIDTLALARRVRDTAHCAPEQAEGGAMAGELPLVKRRLGFNLAATMGSIMILLRH